jgi:uncharacterized NAD(P)/FAD-binding protein YdhS
LPVLTIAIIGAGFSGTLTAVQLARRHADRIGRIVLFDRSGTFGPGLAYSTPSPVHYLNVPAGNMSALDDDPAHFLRWAQARDASIHSGSFVPRGVYGQYLRSLLDDAHARTPGLIQSRPAAATAVSLQSDARVLVDTADRQPVLADRVAVCTGNAPSPDVPGLDPAARAHAAYLASPWAPGAIASIRPDEPVLCVGTGLTMMDVVMQLHAQRHAGRIFAISRHGLLSRSHRSPSRPPAHAHPPESLAAWDGTARAMLRLLRTAVREHAAQSADWRDVIASLRPVTPALWNRLSEPERARFLARLRSYWDVVRHRAAPETAALVGDLIAARQLVVRAGRIRRVAVADAAPGAGRLLEVDFCPRGSVNVQTLRVARVINCTGPQTDPRRAADPLIARLIADGLATPDAHGLGLELADNHALIDARGRPSDRLFAVGPFRRAQHWEATAVPELKKQAALVASVLAGATVTSPA